MSSDNKERTYGSRWSPVAEDPACCVHSVWCSTRRAHFQCHNKRGKGADGLYCGTHDPAAVQARRERSEAKYRERLARDPLTIARKSIEALEAEVAALKRKLFPYADATEISGMSWSGFYLIGDRKSINELKKIQNRSDQLEIYYQEYTRRNKAAEARAERLLEMLDAIKDAADLQTAVDMARKALEDDKQ